MDFFARGKKKRSDMDTESFSLLRLKDSAGLPVYHYTLKPQVKATALELARLTESLRLICDAPDQKSSVVLDCSALRGVEAMQRLLALDLFKAASRIGHTGLQRFVLVTEQKALRKVAQTIIKLQHADAYTTVCPSVEKALELVV
jgi:hypothetical protein